MHKKKKKKKKKPKKQTEKTEKTEKFIPFMKISASTRILICRLKQFLQIIEQ
jgi:hypothetical protein